MANKSTRWLCVDCTRDTHGEHYFVKNSVWQGEAGMGERGMLCIGCLETRIQRTLTRSDFTNAHINDPRRNLMTMRLQSRITASKSESLTAV